MEPTNLNSSDDPQLEQWLRSAVVTEIADDGFTSRVMANLPATNPRTAPRFPWTRVASMLIGASAGAAVIVWRGVVLPSNAAVAQVAASLANPSFVWGVSVTAVCLAMIFVPRLHRLWS